MRKTVTFPLLAPLVFAAAASAQDAPAQAARTNGYDTLCASCPAR